MAGAIISRRSLQAELISETGDSFEVLLQPLNHRKSPGDERQKEKVMQGKVVYLARSTLTLWLRLNASREAVSR